MSAAILIVAENTDPRALPLGSESLLIWMILQAPVRESDLRIRLAREIRHFDARVRAAIATLSDLESIVSAASRLGLADIIERTHVHCGRVRHALESCKQEACLRRGLLAEFNATLLTAMKAGRVAIL